MTPQNIVLRASLVLLLACGPTGAQMEMTPPPGGAGGGGDTVTGLGGNGRAGGGTGEAGGGWATGGGMASTADAGQKVNGAEVLWGFLDGTDRAGIEALDYQNNAKGWVGHASALNRAVTTTGTINESADGGLSYQPGGSSLTVNRRGGYSFTIRIASLVGNPTTSSWPRQGEGWSLGMRGPDHSLDFVTSGDKTTVTGTVALASLDDETVTLDMSVTRESDRATNCDASGCTVDSFTSWESSGRVVRRGLTLTVNSLSGTVETCSGQCAGAPSYRFIFDHDESLTLEGKRVDFKWNDSVERPETSRLQYDWNGTVKIGAATVGGFFVQPLAATTVDNFIFQFGSDTFVTAAHAR